MTSDPRPTTRPSREALVFLAILTVVAGLLRVAYVRTVVIDRPVRADAAEYVQYADNLVDHGTFSKQAGTERPRPDSFRSPGYPAFLALVRVATNARSTTDALPAVQIVQALLSTALVPLTFAFGVGFLGARGALVAATLVAFAPHTVTLASYALTEIPTALLLLAGLVLLARGARRGGRATLVASGALLALAGTVNEGTAPLPWLLALLVAWQGRRGTLPGARLSKGALAAFLVAPLLVQGALAVRNATAVEEGAPRGGQRALATLTHGAYPGFVHEREEYRYYPYLDDPEQPAISRSWSRFARVFATRVTERPVRYAAWYLFEKPATLWSWNILQGQGDVYVYPVKRSLYDQVPAADATRLAMKVLHLPLVLLAAFALASRARRARFEIAVLLLVVGYATALYTVFAPWPRYAVPLRPQLALLAVAGFLALRPLGARMRSTLAAGRRRLRARGPKSPPKPIA